MRKRDRSGQADRKRTGGSKGAAAMAAVLAASGVLGLGGEDAWCVRAWAAPETLAEESQASGDGQTGESSQGAANDTRTAGSEDSQELSGDGAALGEDEGVIVISTPLEFLDFARNCTSETYSKGKSFALGADLNMQGAEFVPVPVFAGIFDGRGHAIVGLSVKGSGSDLGLFRFVQQAGVVKNLEVHGNFAPQGSRTNIGGIVGTNRGTVENCSFEGEMMAQEALGGIVGYNEETGLVTGCESRAQLTGNLKTGGIVGYNEGQVENCVNRGDINATGQEVVDDSDSQLSAGSVGLEESVRVERVNDAGGITGLSLGYIRNCENYGAVGYPHMGYNVGGIAGRQSGLVDQCRNYGKVQGRKDTGGIVGQFEPYVTVAYEEDMFGNLENQMDELSGMGDSLSGIIENAGDTASGNLDRIDAQVESMRGIARFYKDVYREGGDGFDRDADRSINEIQNTLDHMNLDLMDQATKNHYQAAVQKVNQMAALRAEMEKGYGGDVENIQPDELAAWLKKRLEQLEQLAKYGDELQAEVAWLAANAPRNTVNQVEDFGDDLEELQVETNTLIDIVRVNTDKARGDLHSMDEEMTAQVDAISSSMDALTDGLRDSRNQIRNQKRQIEDQIDQIRGTISDGVDRAKEDRELFEDVSDLEGDGLDLGMINGCENKGEVSADYQAGGIAGIIGLETSLDPEQDLEAKEERTLNVTRNLKAIVLECKNQEHITVVNDYAGGIVGKANLGALIQNQNFGDITAEDGNYAGGITGSSAYVLRRNYNMCTIDANDYAGGIAGWGTDILDNFSMVSFVNPDKQWLGAVAGEADEEGVIQGNFYVDENIGALDGVTYEGQAQGLPYDSFKDMEGMPEEFGILTVTFQVEDQVLKTVNCEYGTGVPKDEIPQVPQKDGYYYVWEEKDLSCIKGNQKVMAEYRAWNTTIASSDDKMPVLLAEANFYPGTSLVLEKQGGDGEENRVREEVWPIPEGLKVKGVYQYSITQPKGVPEPETITVHVLADGYGKDAVIGLVEDGSIRMADSRRDGPYLVFEMSGSGEFAVLEPEKNTALWAALAGGAAVLAGIWAVLAGRTKKRGKSDAQAAEEGKESQETQTKEKAGESEEGPEETPRGEEKEQESRGQTQADRQEKGADSVGSNTAGEVGGD